MQSACTHLSDNLRGALDEGGNQHALICQTTFGAHLNQRGATQHEEGVCQTRTVSADKHVGDPRGMHIAAQAA